VIVSGSVGMGIEGQRKDFLGLDLSEHLMSSVTFNRKIKAVIGPARLVQKAALGGLGMGSIPGQT